MVVVHLSHHRGRGPGKGSYACPVCTERSTEVRDSRPREDGFIRRRRYCTSCTHSFTTVEVPAEMLASLDLMKLTGAASASLKRAVTDFNALSKALKESARRAKRS